MNTDKMINVASLIKKSAKHNILIENILVLLFVISLISISVPYGFPLFGPVTLFFTLVYVLFSGRVSLIFTKEIVFYFLCSFILILSMVAHKDVLNAVLLTDLINIFEGIAIYYLISQIRPQHYERFISKLFIIVFAVSCAIAILSFYKYAAQLSGTRVPLLDKLVALERPGTSLVRDYNSFALALNIGLFSSLHILQYKRSIISRVSTSAGIMLISISVIFSMSRRGWVILLGFSIILFWRIIKHIRKKTKISSPAILFILLALIVIFISLISKFVQLPESTDFASLFSRLSSLRLENMTRSLAPRTNRITFGLNIFAERPIIQKIFGGGFSYIFEYGEYFSSPTGMDYPHNHLISALLYSGILGMILLILFLILLFRWVILNRNTINTELILIFIVTAIVMSISSNSIFSSIIFIFIMLLVMCYPTNSRNLKFVDIKYKK